MQRAAIGEVELGGVALLQRKHVAVHRHRDSQAAAADVDHAQLQDLTAVFVDRKLQVGRIGDRRLQPVQFAALQVHQLVREGHAEGNMAFVAHALQAIQAEAHHHPVQLGEAQQVAGVFGGAVGGLGRAAVQQQPIVVFVQFQHRGGEGLIAAAQMGVDQRTLVDQRLQQLPDLAGVADQVPVIRAVVVRGMGSVVCVEAAFGHGIC
ncbi:hypothetical protein D3C71_1334390 [compost metagenome]